MVAIVIDELLDKKIHIDFAVIKSNTNAIKRKFRCFFQLLHQTESETGELSNRLIPSAKMVTAFDRPSADIHGI
ncbi:protein of unknown function [Pararobbsia alpina]